MSVGKTDYAINYLLDNMPEMDGGIANTNNVNASSYKDVSISFSKTFSAVPTVVCCIQSSSTANQIGRLTTAPHDITRTGFICRVYNSDTSQRNPNISWLAIRA